jgi:hypothetical protein
MLARQPHREYEEVMTMRAIRREQRIWREFSLAQIFPMLVPEWITDAEIAEALYDCEKSNELPWSIPAECLTWKSTDTDGRLQ